MAIKKTKKLSAQTATTTVATGEKFAKVDANGKVTLIDLASLKTALLGGIDARAILDNVFIMYHRKRDNYPVLSAPNAWKALQDAGEVADGVAVMDGGHLLVVAPTCSPGTLPWSSANIIGGGFSSTDGIGVISDFNGQNNTSSIISKSTSSAVTNTTAYAPGFCNAYSRVNANGEGLTAGKWWMPSVGEMLLIFANLRKINYCLSLISGAVLIADLWHWTSSEYNSSNGWYVTIGEGVISTNQKSALGKVRPVSAFIR